ncbi:MAG: polysaccharide deacetylase family protein [Chloroflexi bacterium]|nr:polysaccharide deacetylase family protein [Chloroflexota bacterium]
MKNKPIASLSLDLDNQWSYMKTHGDTGWESYPSYLDVVVPRVLDFLAERDLTITFFIVGQDAALAKNKAALASLPAAGHEIGNHSFLHEQWLHLYSEQQIMDDLAQAEEAITEVTGQRPIGFRGPGFSCSEAVLSVLAQRGYLYDASTFPTFIGPLARAYYFMTATLNQEEKEERALLFGTMKDALRPLKPYQWAISPQNGEQRLLEIPVTTMPIFKIPIHASYILYLSKYSSKLALIYFKAALNLCHLTGVQVSLLLHPLDFLGSDDVDELAFFPGMDILRDKKLAVMSEILRLLTQKFRVVTMQRHAHELLKLANQRVVEPNFGAEQLTHSK